MQTHKNPSLRTGPAPFKSPAQSGGSNSVAAPATAAAKAPVFERDGKKWIIEYQKNNTGLLVENAEMNNVVYVFRCEGSTLTVKGKVNNIVFDSCKGHRKGGIPTEWKTGGDSEGVAQRGGAPKTREAVHRSA